MECGASLDECNNIKQFKQTKEKSHTDPLLLFSTIAIKQATLAFLNANKRS